MTDHWATEVASLNPRFPNRDSPGSFPPNWSLCAVSPGSVLPPFSSSLSLWLQLGLYPSPSSGGHHTLDTTPHAQQHPSESQSHRSFPLPPLTFPAKPTYLRNNNPSRFPFSVLYFHLYISISPPSLPLSFSFPFLSFFLLLADPALYYFYFLSPGYIHAIQYVNVNAPNTNLTHSRVYMCIFIYFKIPNGPKRDNHALLRCTDANHPSTRRSPTSPKRKKKKGPKASWPLFRIPSVLSPPP